MRRVSFRLGCCVRAAKEEALLREELRKVKLEVHGLQKQIDEKFNKQVRWTSTQGSGQSPEPKFGP